MKSLLTIITLPILLCTTPLQGQAAPDAPQPVAMQPTAGQPQSTDSAGSASVIPLDQARVGASSAAQGDMINGSRAIPASTVFTYQGQLKIGGVPANAPQDIQFTLTDEAGAAIVVTPPAVNPMCVDNVTCTDGLFTVELDFGASYPGDQRELAIAVRPAGGLGDCGVGGGYTALSPRQKLRATPYAQGLVLPYEGISDQTTSGKAVAHVRERNGNSWVSAIQGTHGSEHYPLYYPVEGAGLYGESETGSGVAGFTTSYFGVFGDALGSSGMNFGGVMVTHSSQGVGVYGGTAGGSTTGSMPNSGVTGYSATGQGVAGNSDTGKAVFGTVPSNSSVNYAVFGTCSNPNGYAAYFTGGRNYFGGNVGIGTTAPTYPLHVEDTDPTRTVFADNTAASGLAYGVYGRVASNSGYGIYGTAPYYGLRADATYTTAYANTRGIWGAAANDGGAGVYGTGGLYGVQGFSSTGIGVYGNTTDTTIAVYGYASATTGINYGVTGRTVSDAGRGVYGDANSATGTNYGVYGRTASPSGYAGYFTGPTGSMNYFQQDVGIGTTSPDTKLHVVGGTDSAAGSGGYIVTGAVTGLNLSLDDNEIMARSNGAVSPLYLNNDGGDVIMNGSGSSVGIGDPTPTDGKLVVNGGAATGVRIDSGGSTLTNASLHIENTNPAGIGAWINGTSTDAMVVIGNDGTGSIIRAFGNHDPCCPVFRVEANGWTGINSTAAPGAPLDVERSAGTVAIFNRTTSDGTIIELQQGGVIEGTISVSGATVSYNAFTGSHFGWTDQKIERGTLVTLSGRNRVYHGRADGEPIYGIVPSKKANDSSCLGAYLGLLEPGQAASNDNPHQVMAVGNGDMWVVDTGRNLQPGQYLISSDHEGHAMLDDEGRFSVGHVIARVGEPVDWAKVADRVDGRKHKKISVFFESFERGSAVAVGKLVEQQRSEIQNLHLRLESLERGASSKTHLSAVGIVQSGTPMTLLALGALAVVCARRSTKKGAAR